MEARVHDQQTPTSRDKRTRDVPGSAQVFGAAFPVVVGLVMAVTVSGAVVTILAALAALALSVAVLAGFSASLSRRRKALAVAVAIGSALVFIGSAVAVATIGRDERANHADAAEPAQNGTSPQPVLSVSEYRLVPSSDTSTNDQDKVDLDTGCPGWGSMEILIGPKRCGELAELILEEDELHSPDNSPTIARLDKGVRAAHGVCRQLLGRAAGTVGRVDISELRAGTELCVRTERGRIAAVNVASIGPGPVLVINFQVWSP